MIEVPVYIPSRRVAGRERRMGDFFARTLVPRSAVVGKPDDDDDTMIVVYYEGNKNGASNMVTFADKAMFAYWRMRDHYPTVAMMAVPRTQLVRTGTLYPEYGRVEVANARQLMALARWLEIPADTGLSERLASELRCEGVRVVAGALGVSG